MKSRILQYTLILLTISGITAGYFYYRSNAAETFRGALISDLGSETKTINASQIGKVANGLTHYWTFDGADMNGDTAYDLVGSNDGTLRNFDILQSSKPFRTIGKIGQALDFSVGDGGQTVSLATGITTGFTYSLSMWIKHNSADATDGQHLFGQGNLTSIRYDGSVNKINFRYSGTPHYNNTAISQNAWHHLIVTVNSGSVTFYVDGVADGTASGAPTMTNVPSLGNVSDKAFGGAIDEIRYYSNKVLSQSEITELYQQGQTKINASQTNKLTSGLVGYWTMDGADMTATEAIDKSPSGRNGALSGVTKPNPAIGKIGQGLNFNGSTGYVNIPDTENTYDFEAGPFSASFWYKTSIAQGAAILEKDDSSSFENNGLMIYTNNGGLDGQAIRYWNGTDNNIKNLSANVFNGSWHHVVVTREGTGVNQTKGYFDGVNTMTITDARTLTNGYFLGIGSDGEGNEAFFNGSLDEVRIYNRALSVSEVTELYNMGR